MLQDILLLHHLTYSLHSAECYYIIFRNVDALK